MSCATVASPNKVNSRISPNSPESPNLRFKMSIAVPQTPSERCLTPSFAPTDCMPSSSTSPEFNYKSQLFSPLSTNTSPAKNLFSFYESSPLTQNTPTTPETPKASDKSITLTVWSFIETVFKPTCSSVQTEKKVGYRGNLKDGKLHGLGEVILKDGARYVGQFECGEAHGKGTFTSSQKTIQTGIFSKGKLHGNGLCIQNINEICSGSFKEGVCTSGLFYAGKNYALLRINDTTSVEIYCHEKEGIRYVALKKVINEIALLQVPIFKVSEKEKTLLYIDAYNEQGEVESSYSEIYLRKADKEMAHALLKETQAGLNCASKIAENIKRKTPRLLENSAVQSFNLFVQNLLG